MSDDERWPEYQVCQKRGHVAGDFRTASIPPKEKCIFCGTTFYYERVLREVNPPVAAASDTAGGTTP